MTGLQIYYAVATAICLGMTVLSNIELRRAPSTLWAVSTSVWGFFTGFSGALILTLSNIL